MAGILDDYRRLRAMDNVYGVERLFDSLLLLLRVLSPSFWLRTRLPSSRGPERWIRSNVIDSYCVAEAVILLLFLTLSKPGSTLAVIVAAFVLFEIFLTLGNIVFIGKFEDLQAVPVSVERSLILLFLNVIDVVLAFAIFYRHWLLSEPVEALFYACLVLGTIGYPEELAGNARLLVAFQVFLDLALLALVLSSFSGQVGLFNRQSPRRAAGVDE